MSIGIVSSSEFDAELELYKKKPEIKEIELVKGRGNTNAVPESLRKIVAEESISGTTAKELAKVFDISQSSISAYKKGATSTSTINNPKAELLDHVNNIKDNLSLKARGRLIKAIDSITDDKLANGKLKDVSSVARDMSTVMANLDRQNNEGGVKIDQVVIYKPRMREEEDYEQISVNE